MRLLLPLFLFFYQFRGEQTNTASECRTDRNNFRKSQDKDWIRMCARRARNSLTGGEFTQFRIF